MAIHGYPRPMLASLLPGFRQVRTPLAVGYSYFIAAWILFGSENVLPDRDDAGLGGKLALLADLVGTGGVLAALAVLAYLFGSVLLIPAASLIYVADPTNQKAMVRWAWDGLLWADATFADVRPGVTVLQCARNFRLHPGFRRECEVMVRLGGTEPQRPVVSGDGTRWTRPPIEAEEDLAEAGSQYLIPMLLRVVVLDELRPLATQLRAEQDAVFQEYDRLRSEAELRLNLAPAIFFVGMALAITWNWLWLAVALVIVGVLAHQGYRSFKASLQDMLTALRLGLVQSPTANQLLGMEPSMDLAGDLNWLRQRRQMHTGSGEESED